MKRSLVLMSVLAFAITALGAPSGAQAQSNKDKARKHFKQGEVYYQQGSFRQALKEYKKAHALKAHPALIFNMGQCHRQLGEYRKALFSYKLYLSEQPNAPNKSEVVRYIKAMQKKVEAMERSQKRLGRVSVVSQPAGAQILVDQFKGTPVGTTPTVMKLAPGKHIIVIKLKGYKPTHKTVDVKEGSLSVYNVTLKKLATTTTRPTPTRDGGDKPRDTTPPPRDPRDPRTTPDPRVGGETGGETGRETGGAAGGGEVTITKKATKRPAFYKTWWFWTGSAAVLALGASAGITGYLTMDARSKWMDDYNKSDKDRGETLRVVTDVLWGTAALGAVGVAVGAILYHYGGKKKDDTERAIVTPTCDGHGCGLTVTGRF